MENILAGVVFLATIEVWQVIVVVLIILIIALFMAIKEFNKIIQDEDESE
jgi:cell division protein FtsW (lipid II flippase)